MVKTTDTILLDLGNGTPIASGQCVCEGGGEGEGSISDSPPIQAKGAKILYTRHPPPPAMKCHNKYPEQFFLIILFKHHIKPASTSIFVFYYIYGKNDISLLTYSLHDGSGEREF
jgi:hypothetical protein